jgi:hypothetical protein
MSTSRNRILPLAELLNVADFRNLRFGCKPIGSKFVTSLFRPGDPLSSYEIVEHYDLLHTAPDAQTLGSCTCNAFTGIVEDNIFRTHGVVVQLDYDKLYKEVRREIYGDEADEGAQLDEPFTIASRRGMIPPSAMMRRPAIDMSSICSALKSGPIVLGLSVHEGWAPANLNRDNGAVDESMDAHLMPYTNGHAMKLVATNRHNNCDGLVLRQSWGNIGIENKGLVFVSAAHFVRWAIDLPVAVDFGPDWPAWRGWEEWVVK